MKKLFSCLLMCWVDFLIPLLTFIAFIFFFIESGYNASYHDFCLLMCGGFSAFFISSFDDALIHLEELLEEDSDHD